jgi:UDP-N-acetylmuramoyl-L-alanyl-D-glutamate--2,6-diaminopimelate ligase
MGLPSAGIGTLGVRLQGLEAGQKIDLPPSASMTTPDPVALHRDLKILQEGGVQHLAMEASSHGLDQYRLDGVRIRAAGFTSFSRDHLDYHKTEEAYLAAKLRLFSEVCDKEGAAILNADIPEFEALSKTALERGLTFLSYGFEGMALKIIALQSMPNGQHLTLDVFGRRYDLRIPLAGRFQTYNALCALGLVLAEYQDAPPELAIKSLENLSSVPGRLQRVEGHPAGAGVYVDYAHTPDAIITALQALKPHTQGKLVCIFGCGGDRDAGKRPLMGKAAAENADIAIVTDDNPRSEDPASIRAQAAAASDKILNIGGRHEAIAQALEMLEASDVLVITGKGHEQGQEFADHIEDFCDVRETQKLLNNMQEEREQ